MDATVEGAGTVPHVQHRGPRIPRRRHTYERRCDRIDRPGKPGGESGTASRRCDRRTRRDGGGERSGATLATGPNGVGSLGVGLAPAGAVVTQVRAGSAAERAGLQVGDWIAAINAATSRMARNGTRIEQRVTIGTQPQ